MISHYTMEFTRLGDAFAGRAIGPSNPSEFVRFGDLLREEGIFSAMPSFPINWEWYDDDESTPPVLDLIPTFSSGMVVSDRAYKVVGSLFPSKSTPYSSLDLDGVAYHWVGPPSGRGDAVDINMMGFDPDAPVIKLLPGPVTVCSESFKNIWMQAGLTGCEFAPVVF